MSVVKARLVQFTHSLVVEIYSPRACMHLLASFSCGRNVQLLTATVSSITSHDTACTVPCMCSTMYVQYQYIVDNFVANRVVPHEFIIFPTQHHPFDVTTESRKHER